MKPAVAAVGEPETTAIRPRTGRNCLVVERLFDAILERDRERILSFFSDESRLDQSTLESAVGADAIWQSLAEGLGQAEQVEWQIRDISETDCGQVLTRHGGRYLAAGRWHEFQLDDRFEVRGCKILSWCADRPADGG